MANDQSRLTRYTPKGRARPVARLGHVILAAMALAGCSKESMPILNPVGAVGEAEANVFYVAVIVMAVIGIPVILATLWIAWRYRASSNRHDYDESFDDSPVIHQVTLFVPLFTITILGAMTWVYTHRLDPYRPLAGEQRPYEIQAISLDYKWLFVYPEAGIATINELVAPTDRPVTLRMTSDPMMTAIFIPGLISQMYTMPGMESRANFLADKQATIQGSNVMYSGPGFEYQRFKAHLVSPEKFAAWVASVKAGQGGAPRNVPLLDLKHYDALTAPTTDTPITHFAAIDPTLFTQVVRKYMPSYRMNPLPTRKEFDSRTKPAGTMVHGEQQAAAQDRPATALGNPHAEHAKARATAPIVQTTSEEGR
jgi:cytochrome o ubiquinol oxidase subunit 2